MKLLTKLTSMFDHTIDLFAGVACVIVFFLVASISAEIIMRYFLNRPQAWVVPVSEISLLYITFLGIAWVLKREGHVRVDILVNKLSPVTRVIFNASTSIIGAVVCLIIIWYGAHETWGHVVRGLYLPEATYISSAAVMIIIPIGFFLFFIQLIRRTYKYLGELRTPPEPEQR